MERPWVVVLQLLVLVTWIATGQAELCDVTTGQAIIILDITESRDTQVNQTTSPAELPVEGEAGVDVEVVVSEEGAEYFTLTGRSLNLIKPLDRDQGTSTLRFQITCRVLSGERTTTIPVIVRVTDINDNPPVFSGLPYSITIPEVTPVGSTIFRDVHADDLDGGVNGQVVYSVIPGSSSSSDVTDGYGFFSINLPHQGLVTVNRSLDYERSSLYQLTILAADRAEPSESRLSSTVTLIVRVEDSDDQDPVFDYASCPRVGSICANPEYTAVITSGRVSGVLSVKPEKIFAADQDSLATPVEYSFMSGRPGTYDRHFAINPQTGVVTHTEAIDRAVSSQFEITIKAEEKSAAKRFATARLVINVAGVDASPPMVTASSYTGTVDENSPPGTPVYDDHPQPQPIILSVSDSDLTGDDTPPTYTWELTTTAFRIGIGGRLEVAEDSRLDRDPPNPGLYTFQVVAREAWEGGAASVPITLTVVLNDVNDNPPRLPVYPPLAVQAGAARRVITQISAKDNDESENAEVTYSIHHVSSRGGRDKFSINSTTGEVALVGEVSAGEQYSVTLRATDNGGLYTQSILEVRVNRGPNTGGPVFTVPRYSASISEGAPPNSALITLSALDPEGDPAKFSLLSGDSQHFDIGASSGTIRVVSQLDRETQDTYALVVKAEDPEGQFNTATVSVIVQDINDKNPDFIGLPYSFRVNEGQEDAVVGTVEAVDDDDEENGEVFYSVPEDSAFIIASDTGNIKTKQALDYEKQQVHYLVVTAQDGANDPRLSTATVTVLVTDTGDEPPIFTQQVYQTAVKENVPDTPLVTVTATDPDTVPAITYVMVNGDSQLFSVEPQTGLISTTRGLDYEVASRHTIVVGTQENEGGPQSTCSVLVTVEDANDNPPVFSLSVPPRSLPESSPPGTLVVTLLASDADGTRPNNVIEYELTGYGRAGDFFAIEKDSGVITLKTSLETETESDFELEIVARDGGSPQLTTTSTVSILVERVREESPPPKEVWAALTDTQFSVEVPEDTNVGSLLKKLTVLDTPSKPTSIRCIITQGNVEEIFGMEVTSEGHCGLLLQAPLDFELTHHYTLHIELDAPISPEGNEIRKAQVDITVMDVNDNEPEFIFTQPYSDKTLGKYYAFVAEDSKISTSVLQVSAMDMDSGRYGEIEYELVPESNRGGYFSVGRSSGLLRTEREMTSVPHDLLPFNLTLMAHDNPNAKDDASHATSVPVIVNLVEEIHRLVLVVEATPALVRSRQEQLVAVLQEHSNQIIGIEKIESRRFMGNESIETDSSGTDVWFHVVDSATGNLLHRHHPHVKQLVEGDPDRKTLLYHVTAAMEGNRAIDIRPPILLQPIRSTPAPPAKAGVALEGFQVALMALAGIIVILGMAGICYICVQWKRYVRHRAEANKAVVVVAPPYERVGSVSEPVAKEYEVQVLHMSVPMDDDSVQDMTIDSRHSHHFSMDNVSYITKQQLSEDSSSRSSGEPGEGMDLTPRNHDHHEGDDDLDWDTPLGPYHPRHPASSPSRNPAYDHFGGEDLPGEGPLSVSTTNENVMFGRRGLTDPSPVQTTTEL
ncbi:hypothetical protein Pmani_011328 [Petrolisthes manimaculis]|uniref:Cadherin domain-containing protein n=1 Tax=Petrolisthes manimaculis TaxID=1843537 RepID=A0AAE1Q350_9EUCA|nr:hypothetical protein Pmani_011328 [Petrolisthes manimaculis]